MNAIPGAIGGVCILVALVVVVTGMVLGVALDHGRPRKPRPQVGDDTLAMLARRPCSGEELERLASEQDFRLHEAIDQILRGDGHG